MTAVLCVVCSACGNQQEVRHPATAKAASAQEDSPAASDAEPVAGTDSDSPRASDAPTDDAKKKPVNASIADVCEKLTRRATEKCSKQVAGLYRTSCRRYLKASGPCDSELGRALECQVKSPEDLLCAHELDPNCSTVFRDLKTCEHGAAPAEQNTAEDLTLPSSWAKVRDTELGFTVAMPRAAQLDDKSAHRTWKAEEDGITYLVAALDPPSGKLNNQVLLRTVIAYVGSRCQLRIKLHGQLELKGTTVVRYDSGCPDGTEWHGMLHIWNGKAVSTGFHAPAGSKGVLEPYFYSFEVAN